MALPNTEPDKNKNDSGGKARPRTDHPSASAHKTSGLRHTQTVPNATSADTRQLTTDEQRYWNRQIFVQWVLAVGTWLAFAAAAYYAVLAKNQVIISQRALENNQRPILSITAVDRTFVVGQMPRINLEIDNLGKVPATQVRIDQCPGIMLVPSDKSKFADCKGRENRGRLVIFPGSPDLEIAYSEVALSPADEIAFQSHTKAFYVIGIIYYSDASKGAYFTKFCLRYPGITHGPIEWPSSQYQSCPNPDSNDAN